MRDSQVVIWQRVKSYLEDVRGLDRPTVARDTGFPYPTINRWWSGKHAPDLAGLQSLVVVYGLNGHWAITGEGSPDGTVSKAVNSADVVGSLAYQAGGRAALEQMAGEVERALASARKAWSSSPAPASPEQTQRVRKAAAAVAGVLKQDGTKQGRKAG